MNLDDKTRMLDVLLAGVPRHTPLGSELEGMCLAELDKLEPLFDAILRRELLGFSEFLFTNMVMAGANVEAVELTAQGVCKRYLRQLGVPA
jgi:hypothetical protein